MQISIQFDELFWQKFKVLIWNFSLKLVGTSGTLLWNNLLVWITFSFESNNPFKIEGLRSNDILKLFFTFLKICLFTYFSWFSDTSKIHKSWKPRESKSLLTKFKVQFLGWKDNLILFYLNEMEQLKVRFEKGIKILLHFQVAIFLYFGSQLMRAWPWPSLRRKDDF